MCKILPRLKILADNEGITIGALERTIGASKGVISRAITNGTDIQSKWLQAIVENYPHYSAQWLLSGEGNMLKDFPKDSVAVKNPKDTADDITTQHTNPDTPDYYHKTVSNAPGAIPLVSQTAEGGLSSESFNVMEADITDYYIIPKFRNLGVDFLMEVHGHSMEPHICQGDIVACSVVHSYDRICWNQIYLVSAADRGILVKRIMPGSDGRSLTMVSDNKGFPSFEVPKDEIHSIARVVGSIHLE